ncbi:MAG: squalene-associated FAD-dependent desaturase [Bacteroidetes bacterium]|nr:squalene-associated FAD-dependent desaturase [Bacteroidota bacterium]
MKPAVIVGAGLSGLAAGVALASRRIPVLLLEQRPYAGGRAYSFRDRTTGDIIDNGQHLLIAGYARTRAYLETIGSAHLLDIQKTPELVFHHPRRGYVRLRLPPLPSPLHLLAGVLASDLFSAGDKLGMVRAGVAIARESAEASRVPGGWTIDQWLDCVGASPESRMSFWHPLAISMMNEKPESASARVFVRSLREAFLLHRSGAALAVPRAGLSELLVDPAVSFIRAHGGDVRFGVNVTETLEADGAHADGLSARARSAGGPVTGVRTQDGEVVDASGVILAVPSTAVERLMPASCRARLHLREMSSAAVSPILCIHLWYAHPVSPHPVVGVLGRRIQWVFRHEHFNPVRGARGGAPGEAGREAGMESRRGAPGERLSLVISAAREEAGWTNEALIGAGVQDCVALFGEIARTPSHAVVIREKRATFSLSPSVESLRPGAQTPVSNLFLAGDWTATGLPATVEGAIRSGESAAEQARQACSQ